MSEPTPINLQAFQPFGGGQGKRLTVTTTSASVAIPGFGGGEGDVQSRRVFISNGSGFSIFVLMGQSGVVATTDCIEVLPGCGYLLTPPFVGSAGVWLAAIMEDVGTAKISVCGGIGT